MINSNIKKYLNLELSLIFRNTRPKFLLVITCFFYPFGILFLLNQNGNAYDRDLIIAFEAITGVFMLSYGSFFLAWESSYFKLLYSQPLNWLHYLKAKFLAMLLFCLGSLAIALLYGIYDTNLIFFAIACFLYNMGVNFYILLFFSKYNKAAVDLYKGPLFMEGLTAGQFISTFFLFVIPLLIYHISKSFWRFEIGLLILALLGIIGILLNNFILRKILKSIHKEKYNLLKAYQS